MFSWFLCRCFAVFLGSSAFVRDFIFSFSSLFRVLKYPFPTIFAVRFLKLLRLKVARLFMLQSFIIVNVAASHKLKLLGRFFSGFKAF